MRHRGSQKSLRQAFAYAAEGLTYAVRTQRTFRLQLGIAGGIGLALVWLRPPALDAAIVVLSMVVVLSAELLNTGVEVVVDLLVERNHHQLAKIAKDIAAAGVVITAAGAAVIGLLVLGPPLGAALGVDVLMASRWSRILAVLVVVTGAVALGRLSRGPAGTHGGAGPPNA